MALLKSKNPRSARAQALAYLLNSVLRPHRRGKPGNADSRIGLVLWNRGVIVAVIQGIALVVENIGGTVAQCQRDLKGTPVAVVGKLDVRHLRSQVNGIKGRRDVVIK